MPQILELADARHEVLHVLDRAAGERPDDALDPRIQLVRHEQVELCMNPDRLHFFDAQTEQAIE